MFRKWFKNKEFAVSVVSVLFATIVFLTERMLDYYDNIDDSIIESWNLISDAQGINGNVGQIDAINNLIKNKVNMRGINLSRTYITGANLVGFEAYQANFSESNLNYVDMRRVKIRESNFSNACLEGANMSGVNMEINKIKSRYDPNKKSIKLKILNEDKEIVSDAMPKVTIHQGSYENNFSGVRASSVNFTNANLSNFNFTNANLSYSDFRRANLINANFTNANIEGATFAGKNGVNDAKITQALIDTACLPEGQGMAKLPKGFNQPILKCPKETLEFRGCPGLIK